MSLQKLRASETFKTSKYKNFLKYGSVATIWQLFARTTFLENISFKFLAEWNSEKMKIWIQSNFEFFIIIVISSIYKNFVIAATMYKQH